MATLSVRMAAREAAAETELASSMVVSALQDLVDGDVKDGEVREGCHGGAGGVSVIVSASSRKVGSHASSVDGAIWKPRLPMLCSWVDSREGDMAQGVVQGIEARGERSQLRGMVWIEQLVENRCGTPSTSFNNHPGFAVYNRIIFLLSRGLRRCNPGPEHSLLRPESGRPRIVNSGTQLKCGRNLIHDSCGLFANINR